MGSIIAVPFTVALSLISARPSDIITFCKWIISYAYIEMSRRMTKRRFDLYDMEAHHDPEKVGFFPPKLEYDLESPQQETYLVHAADEVFFYGVNSNSECLITRIARSVNNEAEAWIYLRLNDGKVYKLKETSGYQHSAGDSGREFTCGRLKIHYIIPMRKWRIFYNGLLRETSEEDPTLDRMVYVKFALLWRASSDCFDITADVNSAALAMGFARSKWKTFTPPLKELNDALNFYSQSGVIMGTVQIDEETEDRNLYLFGEKVRFLGETSLEKGAVFTHILGQLSKNGSIVHIIEATIPDVVMKLRFGFVVLPSGVMAPATDADMLMDHISDEENKDIRALFHADGLEFQMKGSVVGKQAHFESKKGWDGSLTMDALNIQINSLTGSGVLVKGKLLKPSRRKTLIGLTKEVPKEIPLAVQFSEELCELSEVTGGKGSSLGMLTRLSKDLQNFIVPNGVVVTTSAYEEFLNKDIKKEIRCLEDVLYGNTSGDVKEACQRVMDDVVKANIPNPVLQVVVKCLQKSFGEKLHTKKFAIRSSATGEDTENMSAAGQMETFLGVTGLSEIMSAVKKCWASQFGFIAVQYKRQNGQVINSPMAVVIQEMVSCDVAGVLFTCDPLTGNPTLMSVTANYGLGESVVSGSEEPDTIILARDVKDKLKIKDKMIGAKSHRIVIKEDEGTRLEEVSEIEKNSCCLSDAMVLRLGNIAVQIEKSYRSNRDIEWGFWNNNLYIFQSRPVTSGTGETDFEIDHEVDGAMRIDQEYFTVCNVGEVMPGATSPLGLDIIFKYFAITLQRRTTVEWQSADRQSYFPKGLVPMSYHVMFYTLDLLEKISEGRAVVEAAMIGLFGRVLDDEDLYEIATERYGRKTTQSMIQKYYRLYQSLILPAPALKKALKHYTGYHIPVEKRRNSQEVFDSMMLACDDIHEAMSCHMLASQASSIWNMFIISILGKARGGMCSDVYRDFSKLLSSISGVESADVPSAMQSLAYHIGKDIKPEKFKEMDCEEIAQYLSTSPTEAGIKFREFLNKHGHRCLKEFDIRSITWGTNPKLLIQLLQNLVGNVSDSAIKKTEDFGEMLSNLDLSLGFKERMILKFLLPRCRGAVQCREGTKSLMIKILDDWRKGYRHLAKVMVSEGRIPDEDLMYFMTVEDIKELLINRSPRIISKASHRRRRYPELDKYIYPEIMKGFPVPVNVYDTPIVPNENNFMMKGIPVSQGVARGFVRVALNLEEASHLKPGEILLTYSTDIGWTPYFPALAGVVTELGGLISHGAVVSREYGLPCIAGLHGATRQFQTGDYVLLDGNKGFLQKLSPPE